MFSYYGSKSKIINYYPPPKHGLIIEPFAGSARYSLKYFDREVLLVDKYDVVVRLWKWLQQCSVNDIVKLPILKKGDKISDLSLSKEETLFLGMLAGAASTAPRNTVSAFSAEQNGRKNKLKRIAEQLYKIKHWTIKQGCYNEIVNQDATWFIDSPYEFGGQAYVENKINFKDLSEWSKSRLGQIIVCENNKATWLPFVPLTQKRGGINFNNEVIWSNEKTNYSDLQQTIF